MRKKFLLLCGLGVALVTGVALAALYPSQPGDYVYYFDENGEQVGQAWIPCYSSDVRQWGEITPNATEWHMTCPPPRD